MSNFQFKEFKIEQDRCAMKVGTDGVLLGAWAVGGKHILDVGMGTGLISLMMAQRNPDAIVDGIDIDADACKQAQENIFESPFADRVRAYHCRLQDYAPSCLYDAIVSNPPFFVDSLKNPDHARSLARHADSLPFAELLDGVSRLLSARGVFSVIIPTDLVEQFTAEAYYRGFYVISKCAVKTVPRKPSKRCLLSFSRQRTSVLQDTEELLSNSDGTRSEWYALLTKDFYVK